MKIEDTYLDDGTTALHWNKYESIFTCYATYISVQAIKQTISYQVVWLHERIQFDPVTPSFLSSIVDL